MNRRDTLALHRLNVMRRRARAATAQRAAAEAQQTCQCPACTLRRTITQALGGGMPGVDVDVQVFPIGGDEQAPDDGTPKPH